MADRETDWRLGGTARAAEVWSCFSGPAWRAPQGGGAESVVSMCYRFVKAGGERETWTRSWPADPVIE